MKKITGLIRLLSPVVQPLSWPDKKLNFSRGAVRQKHAAVEGERREEKGFAMLT